MINDNNIEDWYKDELSKYQVNPDDKGWDAIANKLDETETPLTEDNIESWYKKEATNYRSTPDQHVWNKLSTNLDVQTVWIRVLSSLNRYDRMIWWRNFTLRTSAVLILLFGSYLTYNSIFNTQSTVNSSQSSVLSPQSAKNKNSRQFSVNSSQSSVLNQESIGNQNQSSVLSQQKIKNNNQQTTHHSVPTTQHTSTNTQHPKINTQHSTNTPLYASITLDKFSPKGIGSFELETFEPELALTELQQIDYQTKTLEAKEFLVKKEKNKIIFNDKRFSSHFVFGMYAKRFYVGVNAGFKKQDLFTKVNSNNAISTAKHQRYLDFGYNIGGTVGFIISDKLNLETNVNFISTSGYNRKYESNDLKISENLNLTYSSIDIMAKKMSNKSTFDNKKYSTNMIGGIYAGYLTSAEVNTNRITSDISNQFKTIDLGIVLGIEQDRYLSKQIMITPSIKYRQGLLNISDANNPYESARTFSIEFNIGVKYIFLKKN